MPRPGDPPYSGTYGWFVVNSGGGSGPSGHLAMMPPERAMILPAPQSRSATPALISPTHSDHAAHPRSTRLVKPNGRSRASVERPASARLFGQMRAGTPANPSSGPPRIRCWMNVAGTASSSPRCRANLLGDTRRGRSSLRRRLHGCQSLSSPTVVGSVPRDDVQGCKGLLPGSVHGAHPSVSESARASDSTSARSVRRA